MYASSKEKNINNSISEYLNLACYADGDISSNMITKGNICQEYALGNKKQSKFISKEKIKNQSKGSY
jgi:hypothetical protein